jgi:hypothetical protein
MSSLQRSSSRVDRALDATRKHRCDEAAAYLLERTGDTSGAMALTLRALQRSLDRLSETRDHPPGTLLVPHRGPPSPSRPTATNGATHGGGVRATGAAAGGSGGGVAGVAVGVVEQVDRAADLCERSGSGGGGGSSGIWLDLIDLVVS